MYGYDAGVLGGVQTTKPFLEAMQVCLPFDMCSCYYEADTEAQHPTGTYVIPMIASAYTLAAAVCSLCVACIGMPLGRRNCILLGNILVITGGALQASSWSVPQIIVGRVICGVGIGFISSTTPTYLVRILYRSNIYFTDS